MHRQDPCCIRIKHYFSFTTCFNCVTSSGDFPRRETVAYYRPCNLRVLWTKLEMFLLVFNMDNVFPLVRQRSCATAPEALYILIGANWAYVLYIK